jgi:hypothetical protein
MNGNPSPVILDAHVHLYPCYDLTRALDGLRSRLGQWADSESHDTRYLAMVAERVGNPTLKELIDGPRTQSGGTWTATAADGEAAWLCRNASGAELTLIVGRQFVTREKMEILALGSHPTRWDGLPIRQIIENLRAEGQVPILPWSPGKWLFERGRIARDLVEQMGPALALCDTAIRPRQIPASTIFRLARQAGCRILAGSDPLPVPGEEAGLGGYANGLPEANPTGNAVEIVQDILKNPSSRVTILGQRNSLGQALIRMIRYHRRSALPG